MNVSITPSIDDSHITVNDSKEPTKRPGGVVDGSERLSSEFMENLTRPMEITEGTQLKRSISICR